MGEVFEGLHEAAEEPFQAALHPEGEASHYAVACGAEQAQPLVAQGVGQ